MGIISEFSVYSLSRDIHVMWYGTIRTMFTWILINQGFLVEDGWLYHCSIENRQVVSLQYILMCKVASIHIYVLHYCQSNTMATEFPIFRFVLSKMVDYNTFNCTQGLFYTSNFISIFWQTLFYHYNISMLLRVQNSLLPGIPSHSKVVKALSPCWGHLYAC